MRGRLRKERVGRDRYQEILLEQQLHQLLRARDRRHSLSESMIGAGVEFVDRLRQRCLRASGNWRANSSRIKLALVKSAQRRCC